MLSVFPAKTINISVCINFLKSSIKTLDQRLKLVVKTDLVLVLLLLFPSNKISQLLAVPPLMT